MKVKYQPWVVYPPCTRTPERWCNGIYQPAHIKRKKFDAVNAVYSLLGVVVVVALLYAAIITS